MFRSRLCDVWHVLALQSKPLYGHLLICTLWLCSFGAQKDPPQTAATRLKAHNSLERYCVCVCFVCTGITGIVRMLCNLMLFVLLCFHMQV